MADPPSRRLLYIGLIGWAAVVPLALAGLDYGPFFSFVTLMFVMLFIRSDRRRQAGVRGFPVIFKSRPGHPDDRDEDASHWLPR